ncbi:hypothetical protein [Streptomyces sp. NBC_00063]
MTETPLVAKLSADERADEIPRDVISEQHVIRHRVDGGGLR